jgi:hypothetical protein
MGVEQGEPQPGVCNFGSFLCLISFLNFIFCLLFISWVGWVVLLNTHARIVLFLLLFWIGFE